MSGREVPVDSIILAPLPLWVNPSFSHFDGVPDHQRREDGHHMWHQRRDYDAYLHMVESGISVEEAEGRRAHGYYALRSSRVQRLPRWDHELWHKIYGMPERPVSELHVFVATALLTARYLPESAISFNSAGVPLTVGLPIERRQQMWQQEAVYPADMQVVRRYLLRYIIAKGLDPDARVLEEFMHERDAAQRAVKGADVIRMASRQATERANMMYHEAWQGQCLPANQPDHMAHCVYDLITQDNEAGSGGRGAVAWLGEILGASLPTGEVAV